MKDKFHVMLQLQLFENISHETLPLHCLPLLLIMRRATGTTGFLRLRFEVPRVFHLPGVAPLTKKSGDSEYEIGAAPESD